MEQENKSEWGAVHPFDLTNPAAVKNEEDLGNMLEYVKEKGNNWAYVPLDDDTVKLPMNEIQKVFLIALSKERQQDGQTIYTIEGKDFKIVPNEEV